MRDSSGGKGHAADMAVDVDRVRGSCVWDVRRVVGILSGCAWQLTACPEGPELEYSEHV